MAQAPDGNNTLTADDAAKILEELLDAQNHAKLLGLMLKVKPPDVEAIIKNYKDPKEQLYHIIIVFLQQAELRPTWRAIVDALKSPVVGLTALAKKIESNHFPDVLVSRRAFPEITDSVVNTAPENESEVISNPPTFQMNPAAPIIGDECVSSTSDEINQRIAELKKMFAQLKKAIRDCLEKRKVVVKEVADVLTSASVDEDDEHKLFLESHVSTLFRAEDVPELFGTMNFHWNYLNPPLLDHLVHNFELEEVKDKMESYKIDLKRFRRQTPLMEFCRIQKKRKLWPTANFREMVAEFHWPDVPLTLKIVEQFRQEYASQYNLRDCAMMIAHIRLGSFIVTWIIPVSIVKVLKAKPARVVLKKFSATRLDIDGVCVYRVRKQIENIPVASSASVERGSPTSKPSKPAPIQPKPLSGGGHLYVEQPSEDYYCPVMMGLLLKPHLTSCCGNHLSQEAAERIQGERGVCPLCKEKDWSTMLDKRFQRQVNLLRVFCCHGERGCGWQGELASYKSHIESCPMAEGPLMTELAKLPAYSEEGRVSEVRETTTSKVHSSKTPQLTVRCRIKGEVTFPMRRGSATTDGRFAYFTPFHSNIIYQFDYKSEEHHTKKWNTVPRCPYPGSGLAIIDGELTTVGGVGDHPTKKLMTLHGSEWVEVYPPMEIARSYPAVETTDDGINHMVIGGLLSGSGSEMNWSDAIEIFNAKERKWFKGTSLPLPLSYLSVTVSGDQLYLIGQGPNYAGYSCSLQVSAFDSEPSTTSLVIPSWNPLPPLPVRYSTLATLNGQLVLVGGGETWKPVNSIYQLMDGKWVKIGSTTRVRSNCLVVNQSPQKIIIVGGYGRFGKAIVDAEECIVTN